MVVTLHAKLERIYLINEKSSTIKACTTFEDSATVYDLVIKFS